MGDLLTFARPKPAAIGHYRHVATLHEHGFLRLILARVEGVSPPKLCLLLDGMPGRPEPDALLSIPEDEDGARGAMEVAAMGAYATLLATAGPMDGWGGAA